MLNPKDQYLIIAISIVFIRLKGVWRDSGTSKRQSQLPPRIGSICKCSQGGHQRLWRSNLLLQESRKFQPLCLILYLII